MKRYYFLIKNKNVFIFYILFLFVFLFISLVYSEKVTNQNYGVIKGSFYDFNTFKRINNVILEINTTPPMRIVITNGYYYLNLSEGCYLLKAYTQKDDIFYTSSDVVCVKKDTSVNYDLILFPQENKLSKDILSSADKLNLDLFSQNESLFTIWTFLFILCILMAPLVVFMYCRYHNNIKRKGMLYKDKYMAMLIDILKKERRITQKEIIKRIPLSEAKISLMISQLEDLKMIKKIKKGRTNILYWQGK